MIELHGDRAALTRAVDAAAKVGPKGPVWLRLTGDELIVTGADKSTFVASSVKVGGVTDGSLAVDAMRLLAVLRVCPDDKVELLANDAFVALRLGSFEVQLPIVAADESPPPWVEGPSVTYDRKALRDALARATKVAARDPTRPVLKAVCLEPGEQMAVVASDSYRLSHEVVGGEGPPVPVLVPAAAVGHVVRASRRTESDATVVTYGELWVRFAVGDTTVMARQTDGPYASYRGLLRDYSPTRVVVDRRALVRSVERVRLATYKPTDRHKTVSLVMAGGRFGLRATNGGVTASETLSAEVTGAVPTLQVLFNADFLLDALRAASSRSVEMGFADTLPVTFRYDDDALGHLLAPMKP